MAEAHPPPGSERGAHRSRREFVKTLGTVALSASVPLGDRRQASAAETETAVARFARSLTVEQRRRLCFPFDHPKRSLVANHWAIVEPTIGDLSGEQQALCREIFRALCGEEGHDRFRRQMDDDDGGFARYHVAIFGEPGTDAPSEWVLTGRHVTLRASGDRAGRITSGGPLFYGHAAEVPSVGDPTPNGNVWWYLARQARTIFATLDDAQRQRALVDATATGVPGASGLAVRTLDGPRKVMVQQLLRDLVRPFRAFDSEGIQECLRAPDGADLLRLTFFKDKDAAPGDGRAGDIWRLEGPAFAWSFHATPHVHAWLDIAPRASRG